MAALDNIHKDCRIKWNFEKIYDNDQCNILTCGYNRSICKKYVIPDEVQMIIHQFVGEISFGMKAEEETLSDKFRRIEMFECENGMWITLTDIDCHIPFKVDEFKRLLGGKYGSRKCCFKIKSPFCASQRRHLQYVSSGCTIYSVKTEKIKYLISHFEDHSGELVCFDGNYEEIYWNISKDREVYTKLKKMIKISNDKGKDIYAVVLESYSKRDYCIFQIVVDIETESHLNDNDGVKAQRHQPKYNGF